MTLPRADVPPRSLVVASILGRTLEIVDRAVARFSTEMGGLCFVGEPMEFRWTTYYAAELGEHPVRRIVAAGELRDPAELAKLKRSSCRLEVALASAGQPRQVNIDPGMLNEHQLVLASTKPRAHRIYLGQGIYGDLMLLYTGAEYTALPWTYSDYADDEIRALLGRLRELYLATRRLKAEP